MKYSVLLADPENFRRYHKDISKAIHKVLNTDSYEAAQQTARCGGIISDDLNETEASGLAAELNAAGIDTRIIPSDKIVALPEAESVKKIKLQEDKISFSNAITDIGVTLWKNIILLSSAKVEYEETKTTIEKEGPSAAAKVVRTGIMLSTGLPIGMGKTKEVKNVSIVKKDRFYIDIFYIKPFSHLRIDATEFDYSFLKEEMAANVFSNFRKVISILQEKSPNVSLNSGTIFYLDPPPSNPPFYKSLEDLDRESAAIITMKLIKSKERKQ